MEKKRPFPFPILTFFGYTSSHFSPHITIRTLGIFDSGVGGLTTLRDILLREKTDHSRILYLADTARMPYGGRSPGGIQSATLESLSWLYDQGCDEILIACNTATAHTLSLAQERFPQVRIHGLIDPTVKHALSVSRFGRIGLIATRATVASQAYLASIDHFTDTYYRPSDRRAREKPKLHAVATPLLAPMIEEGYGDHAILRMYLRPLLRPMRHAHIDTLILGCSHYGHISRLIAQMAGSQVTVVDSGLQLSHDFHTLQPEPDADPRELGSPPLEFYTTGDPSLMHLRAQALLKRKLKSSSIQQIHLSPLS